MIGDRDQDPDDGNLDDGVTKAVARPRSILIVGATPQLAQRCRAIAARARVLFSHECDLASLTNIAAERMPLAIVFPEHLYVFDSAEFDALARDIRAAIVPLEPGLSDDDLEIRLGDALLRAEVLRQPEADSGRYAVVPDTHRRFKRR